MKAVSIKITDLSCAACSARVERALAKIEGVGYASVNLATGTARVEFDERRVSVQQLLETIKRAGYTPVLERQQSVRMDLLIEGMT